MGLYVYCDEDTQPQYFKLILSIYLRPSGAYCTCLLQSCLSHVFLKTAAASVILPKDCILSLKQNAHLNLHFYYCRQRRRYLITC